jgi:hypothetical protein
MAQDMGKLSGYDAKKNEERCMNTSLLVASCCVFQIYIGIRITVNTTVYINIEILILADRNLSPGSTTGLAT